MIGPRTLALLLSAAVLSSTGCVSLSPSSHHGTTDVASRSARTVADDADQDDLSLLISSIRHDLGRSKARERERMIEQKPRAIAATRPDPSTISLRTALRAHTQIMRMPVVGVRGNDLEDNFGAPRDGGRRRHRGLDIFAPRGTPVIAAMDGLISYIGVQPKGGRCLWLSTEAGMSFFYAHLDQWAPGIYEGMEVTRGTLLGYVGNTGNAIHTPSHLHFTIIENDDAIDPYPLLKAAAPGRVTSTLGASVAGGR
ncbi:MAG: M23 family metallopeptidase [Thermoanaerobaculia bacterium]